jgi:hypothetical protein
VVVVQVIDNIWIIFCTFAGIILAADIVVKIRVEEDTFDPGYTSGVGGHLRVLDFLEDLIVGDSGLGNDDHVGNNRKNRKTVLKKGVDGTEQTGFHA